jgi:hypothetical protein
MQNSGLSALDRILIVVAGFALGASLENTSRDPRRQAEKYSVDRIVASMLVSSAFLKIRVAETVARP